MKAATQQMASTNHDEKRILAQDDAHTADYKIYVYNILDREWVVNQPPAFPNFRVLPCPRSQKFTVTELPPFIKEVYNQVGTFDHFYKMVDGRKYASQLLNPASFPSTNWENQIMDWQSEDQFGNNLNLLGVWWSLTPPSDIARLEEEIGIFKRIAQKTMEGMIATAEQLAAAGKRNEITPLMHFAMDYLGKQAPWHMAMHHMVACPNCGDPVKEGIAYHKNEFGEKCIIDMERCIALGIVKTRRRASDDEFDDEELLKPAKKKKNAGEQAI